MWKNFVVALIAAATFSGVEAQADDYRLLKLHGRYVKWGEPAFGKGAELSYSFVREPRNFPDAINCKDIAPLDGLVERSHLSESHLGKQVREAFDIWEAVADVRFRYVEDPEAADVLIGAQAVPRGIAFANVTEDRAGDGPIAGIRQAMICFNPLAAWEMTMDGMERTFNIGHVVAHEIGHVIGLDHPGRHGQLMGFDYSEGSPGLKAGDIKGAVRLYGPSHAAAPPPAGQRPRTAPRPD